MPKINMSIGQLLRLGADKLNQHKITNPHLEAEILLSGIIKKPREFLLAHGENILSQSQIKNYWLKINKRFKGEPIAYLTGQKEFYGLNFFVNKNVLIPRPETELLVEEAIKLVTQAKQPVTLIDVGTGSGCIIIALAKSLKQKFIGLDISKKALLVAKKNASAHKVNKKIKFFCGYLLKPIINDIQRTKKNKLIVLANLPYGWKQWKNNSSEATVGLNFEPPIALFTEKNGLAIYENLFWQIANSELNITKLLCEFDPRQTVRIKRLIKKYLPTAQLLIKKDLAGLNRLVIITLKSYSKP
jgi:release factor glutamine methyltransferase